MHGVLIYVPEVIDRESGISEQNRLPVSCLMTNIDDREDHNRRMSNRSIT